MTGIGIILKSLGVKFEEEHVKQIETMLPQIPGVLQNIVQTVQSYLDTLETRQKTLEHQVADLTFAVLQVEKVLHEHRQQRLNEVAQLIDGYAERLERINESIRSGELQRSGTPGVVGSGGNAVSINGKPAKHRRV